MVAIIEPERQNSGDEFVRGIGAIGQAVAGYNQAKIGAAQEARAQETHDIGIEQKQMGLDEKKEALAIQGHYDNFDRENLIAKDQGRQYKPDFTQFTPQQARAYSDWQVSQMGEDVQLSEGAMKLHRIQAAQQYEGIQGHWENAISSVSGESKDYPTAFKSLEKAYELHNDGADLIFDKDGKGYKVKMADGTTTSHSFDSEEAMFNDFAQKMAPLQGEKGQENYFQQYIADQKDRMSRNAKGILNSKYFVNDKGDQAQAATLEDNTGRPANRIRVWDKDGNDLGIISDEEFHKGNFKNVETRKGEAAIGASDAKAAASRATKQADDRKGFSPERKLAADLADTIKAFDGDIDMAMRHVLRAKNAKNLLAAEKITEDLAMDAEEKAAFMKAVQTKLPKKGTKVQPSGGLPVGGGGDVDKAESAGLPDPVAALNEKHPASKLKDGRKAKVDGKMYVVKNGQWELTK
jgi:hypothetical protein